MFKKDSLKKTLLMNYPGCKSAVEAFSLTKSQLNGTASQSTELEKYKLMRQAIIDIELALNGIDIDLLDSKVRDDLRLMSVKTEGEVRAWRDQWMIAISRLKKEM